jgi:hypothetical protein
MRIFDDYPEIKKTRICLGWDLVKPQLKASGFLLIKNYMHRVVEKCQQYTGKGIVINVNRGKIYRWD